MERIVGSELLPEGAVQLLVGSAGDLLDHLESQDVVLFTGSAETARTIRAHPRMVSESVRVNVEADSLNAAVLGPDGTAGAPVREALLKEIHGEMTAKAGQKCTAIRRVFVPAGEADGFAGELGALFGAIRVGAPDEPQTELGPLVDLEAVEAARNAVAELLEEAEVIPGSPEPGAIEPESAFFPPVALRLRDAARADAVHRVEVFGPVLTLIPYDEPRAAAAGCRAGGGSLVTSVFSEDPDFLREFTAGVAAWNGRVMTMSGRALSETTGHGVAMPQLLHGGPGRAGGGEELGGLRALNPFLARCAVQGDPRHPRRALSGRLGDCGETHAAAGARMPGGWTLRSASRVGRYTPGMPL